jgi:hypothetical protein
VTAAWDWLRLSFRLQRWEVLAPALGVAILSAGMLWFAWQLRTLLAATPQCADPSIVVVGCERAAREIQEISAWAERTTYLSYGAPFGIGLLLGVPLVARELESRTAQFAWTLSRSRAAWLAQRVAFAALVLVALLTVVGVVAEILTAASLPDGKPGEDFIWYGRRGFMLVARGLAALGIGVFVGALVARTLPALLAAAFVSVVIFTAVSLGMDRWNETDAVVQAYGVDRSGGLVLGLRVKLASGELVSWEELSARDINIEAIGENGELYADVAAIGRGEDPIGRELELMVPGRLYPLIVLRESAALGGVTLAALGIGLIVVRRRRPG